MSSKELLSSVSNYYRSKFTQFGVSAQGVDWNGTESQEVRFAQFLAMLPDDERFSINDLGCGYGALHEFLNQQNLAHDFHGIDLVDEMVNEATKLHPSAHFTVASKLTTPADYSVASGIFNVKNDTPDNDWLEFILATIDNLNECSTKGFAFNALTSYSDKPKQRPHLYYLDPQLVLELCLRKYSRSVQLLHGYGLYEFTMIVNKVGITPLAD